MKKIIEVFLKVLLCAVIILIVATQREFIIETFWTDFTEYIAGIFTAILAMIATCLYLRSIGKKIILEEMEEKDKN